MVSVSACGAAIENNSSDVLTQSRLLQVTNNYYHYTLLYKHNATANDSARRVEGVRRVTMSSGNAAAADITSLVTSGALTEAKLNEIKVVYSLSDEQFEAYRTAMADMWYVDISAPTIPSGTTTFEVLLRISNAPDETFRDTVDLTEPAQCGLNVE